MILSSSCRLCQKMRDVFLLEKGETVDNINFEPIETRDLVVGVKGGSIAVRILSLLQLQAAVFS